MSRFVDAFKFGTGPWDPSHRFVTSWILPPYALFALRALIALYIFVVRFFIIGWQCSRPDEGGCQSIRDEFSYFTVLTFWGLGFYFLVAAVHTFTYARTGRALIDRFPRPLQALHALFYATVVTFPFLVTIVYWALLYKNPWFPQAFGAWKNVSQHGLNSLFGLVEIFLPRVAPLQLPDASIVWLIVILGMYLGVAYITHATKGFYTYGFLDPATGNGKVAGYCLGILAAIIVVWLIVKLLLWLRMWVTESILHKGGKFSRADTAPRDTEMQPVPKP